MPVVTEEMPDPIRILLVEDTPIDAELASRVLSKAGLRHLMERVDNEPAFLAALASFAPHLILCDYSMPHLDGPTVLELAKVHATALPFIFVSGTIGEEVAIDSLKRGATDYVIKSNLSRLPAAVERALHGALQRASRERAEAALREAQERFSLFMQHLPGPAFIKDPDGRIQFVNAAFESMVDMAALDIVGRTDRELWPHLAAPYVADDEWVLANDRVLQTFELRPQQDGVHSYLVHKFPIPDAGGRPGLVGGVAVDLTARLQAEEKLARLSRIHALMSGINSAIVRTEAKDELLHAVCRIAVEHGGFRMAWLALLDDRGVPCLVGCTGADRATVAERLAAPSAISREAAVAAAVACRGDVVVANPRGDDADHGNGAASDDRCAVAGVPVRLDSKVAGVLALYAVEAGVFDPDEMKLLNDLAGDISFALDYFAKKDRLHHFAYFDSLTGLPNRTLCGDRINQAMQSHGPVGAKLAVLVLDIERFSLVNDSLGRQAGDELLRQVAARLDQLVVPAGTVARVGANAFAAVFGDIREDADVARLIEDRLNGAMSDPFPVNGRDLRIAFKCGVALFPVDGRDAEVLLRNAEVALKSAKGASDRYLFYAAAMNLRVAEVLSLENALRMAVTEEQFVLHYQPKVEIGTNRIYGVEALLRWNRPGVGLVPPAVFLATVEETGMILDVGKWVVRQAARDQHAWLRQAPDGIRMSVNVSSLQLRQKSFVDDTLRILREEGGDPRTFDLEITESVIMENIEQYIPTLKSLRGLGMGIEIDDFGTGYSSLSYLGKLPVTALKIDRSFVTAMTQTQGDRTIISTIISLGQLLNLSVIAEGVETAEQRALLRSLGCDRLQGYLFSRPVPAEQIASLLERQRDDAAVEGRALHAVRSAIRARQGD